MKINEVKIAQLERTYDVLRKLVNDGRMIDVTFQIDSDELPLLVSYYHELYEVGKHLAKKVILQNEEIAGLKHQLKEINDKIRNFE